MRKKRTDADEVLLNFTYKLPSILASIGILKGESNIKFRFWIRPYYQSIYQIDGQSRNSDAYLVYAENPPCCLP